MGVFTETFEKRPGNWKILYTWQEERKQSCIGSEQGVQTAPNRGRPGGGGQHQGTDEYSTARLRIGTFDREVGAQRWIGREASTHADDTISSGPEADIGRNL